jgi:hypothetical protein
MKRFFSLLLVTVCFASLTSCGKTTESIIKNKPSVSGTVVEVGETFITVDMDFSEKESLAIVSTDSVESKDSYKDFIIGDEVKIYYDGTVLETYPVKIQTVYLIVKTGDAVSSSESMSVAVMPQSVMIGGKLYMSTGAENKDEKISGADGEIVSSVSSEELPEENGQSNFGTGFKYKILDDESVLINIDGKMIVFAEKQ